MRRTFTTIICTAILTAALTLTASAADAEQITTTGEEATIETTVATEAQTTATEETTEEVKETVEETVEETKEITEEVGAEIDQIKASGEGKEEKDKGTDGDKIADKYASEMTEEEMREVILRVAEAVGAYEDDIPAAGKVKEWIMGNLASIVGFFMAISLIIATPIGKKIFGNFIAALKGTMTTAKGWKEELEGVIARNGEKNAELRASVNEAMAVFKRESDAANRRAELAEQRAEEYAAELTKAKQEAKEAEERSTAACEAVCRAALVMAKPLEMTVQRSKALDEMQKHEIFAEYSASVDAINALLEGKNTDGEGESVAD